MELALWFVLVGAGALAVTAATARAAGHGWGRALLGGALAAAVILAAAGIAWLVLLPAYPALNQSLARWGAGALWLYLAYRWGRRDARSRAPR